MKILFDLTPLYDHLTGVERYNLNITKSFIKQHPEKHYILIFKEEVHKSFLTVIKQDNVEYRVLPACNKFIFMQVRLLKTLNRIKADYYIFLSFQSPILFRKERIINAICDLSCWDCPNTMPPKMVLYYRFTYRMAVKRSWKIITISKFSQERLINKYNLIRKNVPIIYCGLTEIFKNPPSRHNIRNKYELPEHYFLSLSTVEPRKNLQLLIRAYKEIREEMEGIPELVLAGRKGWKLNKIIDGITPDVKDHIHFTGFVDDEDLPQLYREADLFIFPSIYEGFGLPIIEAMSQGTMVVSSDAASLPEIVGSAGILFKNDDLSDLKDKIYYALKEANSKSGDEGVAARKRNSFKYDWDTEAEKLCKIIVDYNENS